MIKRFELKRFEVGHLIYPVVCVFLVLLIPLADRDFQELLPSWWFNGNVIAMGVVGWVLVIPFLSYMLNKQWDAVTHLIVDTNTTFLTQELVDEKLHQMAKIFHAVCVEEVRAQGVNDAEIQILRLQHRVAQAKESFWTAHALASRLGFKVEGSVNNYLTLPINRSAVRSS